MPNPDEVKLLVAETFGLSPAELADDAALGSVERWDSMGHLELMMAVEARFGVKIPARDMLELTTVPKLAAYLQTAGL